MSIDILQTNHDNLLEQKKSKLQKLDKLKRQEEELQNQITANR